MSDIVKFEGETEESDIETIDFSPDDPAKNKILDPLTAAIAAGAVYLILDFINNKR